MRDILINAVGVTVCVVIFWWIILLAVGIDPLMLF